MNNNFVERNTKKLTALFVMFVVALMPEMALAATTGTEFQAVYTFVHDAATGYLGRAIAITGGIIGLGFGAASGKALPAIVGVVLAMFGAIGPSIINTIFGAGAII